MAGERAVRPSSVLRGWPKMKACLLCDRPRLAKGPGDRLHDKCRAGDDETMYRVIRETLSNPQGIVV